MINRLSTRTAALLLLAATVIASPSTGEEATSPASGHPPASEVGRESIGAARDDASHYHGERDLDEVYRKAETRPGQRSHESDSERETGED